MMMTPCRSRRAVPAGLPAKPRAFDAVGIMRPLLLAVALAILASQDVAKAAEPSESGPALGTRIQALIPEIETYAEGGMKAFDLPGLALGIVANDRLVYGKGFGVRSKTGGEPVDTRTVFQIGSTTKAFLATTLAITVDRGKLRWDERIVDLDPEFQLKDPWVTREFRVFDLLAQRSGLPPYANDALGLLGLAEPALIRSLRYVEPVSSFRSTFAYTNITHLLAGRVVAKAAGAADGDTVLRQELLEPLGMTNSSYTAEAIEAAANHAKGHRWTPDGTIEAPFTQLFPYDFGGAGDINSTIDDMACWVRLQLGNGTFEGRRIVSPESLAFTRTPKVAISDKLFYALGWIIQQTPNGNIVWHNGGTAAFGAYVGMVPDKNIGVIILTNETNVGFPDAIGQWILDLILGNAKVDHVADALKAAKANFGTAAKQFAKSENPRPFPPLAPLAGSFANPSFGKAVVVVEGDALVIELQATGAKLRLEPWDGDVFTARIMPNGRFAAMADNLGPLPNGFVQFQIDKNAKLNLLRLSFDDGQAYEFHRE
ncbi:serine hydrolase [Microvirga sp. VF16]|uniref:serine hydrolase n=1 Tax=Microvirga sp. VF16 TaxID=2807101 RepID=UPI00193CCC80|nr:serine hydrolase [Microvirga sp. VF16]QRM30367.1 serine hydrolase [Microvirga sp. VF16]